MPSGLVFVPTGDLWKPRWTDRRLIRSHCMKGRNVKKQRRVATSSRPLAECSREKNTAQKGQVSIRTPKTRSETIHLSDNQNIKRYAEDQGALATGLCRIAARQLLNTRPPPSDLATIPFAAKIDDKSRELLFKYYNTIRDTAFSAELFIDFNKARATQFQWLTCDAAYLHSVLLASSSFRDLMSGEPLSRTSYTRLVTTLAFLNTHLSYDNAVSLQPSTVAVILCLISLADVFGDSAAAEAHLSGLQQIVRLHGGIESYRESTKVHIKLGYLDLSVMLRTGESLSIATEVPSLEQNLIPMPKVYRPEAPITNYTQTANHNITDHQLLHVYQDLQCLAAKMNIATRNKDRITDSDFLYMTYPIQYRLFHIRDSLTNPTDECICLAMLAFLRTTHQIPQQKFTDSYAADRFRRCYPKLRDVSVYQEVWLLMVSTIAIYDSAEPWVQRRWQTVAPDLSWAQIRDGMSAIMWIDEIHDAPGHKAFELLRIRPWNISNV